MVFTYKDPCSKKRSYRLLLCWLGKLCNHVYYFLIIDLLGPRSVQHKMLVLYQNCNASQTLRSNLIINRVKLNYETSVYIAIACDKPHSDINFCPPVFLPRHFSRGHRQVVTPCGRPRLSCLSGLWMRRRGQTLNWLPVFLPWVY